MWNNTGQKDLLMLNRAVGLFQRKRSGLFSIEPIASDEWLELAKLYRDTYKESYPRFFTDAQLSQMFGADFMMNDLAKLARDPNCVILTVKSGFRLVGYAKLVFREDKTVFLEKLYLAKAYQEMGLGRELMQACVWQAQKRGVEKMELLVWTQNERAIQFYEKMGFCMDEYGLVPYVNPDGSESGEYDFRMSATIKGLALSRKQDNTRNSTCF